MDHTYRNQMYLYYILANCAAPVFAGVKPSCLITIWKHRITELNFKDYVQNQDLTEFYGCKFKILLETPLYYLLFCYNEILLMESLYQVKESDLLQGYFIEKSMEESIYTLEQRIKIYNREKKGFPHEVGLFLGYPIWDVEGFVQNNGQNYQMIGYWKVYDDISGAIRKFQEFDRLKRKAVYIFKQSTERNNYKK